MPLIINRRTMLIGSAMLYPALVLPGTARAVTEANNDVSKQLGELEKRTGGRLGVAVLDTETNISFGHRENERFAMCSTFKALAAACVLARVDRGRKSSTGASNSGRARWFPIRRRPRNMREATA